jgi:hypothetical protein
MSCQSCQRVPSQAECPPRMSDGRHFTDYRPRCAQRMGTETAGNTSSYEFRQFLIQNGAKLMDESRNQAYSKNGCVECFQVDAQGTVSAEQTRITCNARTCTSAPVDSQGIGQGRDYGSQKKTNMTFYPIGGASESDYDLHGSVF